MSKIQLTQSLQEPNLFINVLHKGARFGLMIKFFTLQLKAFLDKKKSWYHSMGYPGHRWIFVKELLNAAILEVWLFIYHNWQRRLLNRI